MRQSHYDYSLFIKRTGKELVIILVYVDDLIVTGNSQTLINKAREDLQHSFKMKDLGELKFFLGIEVARSNEGIVMCQRKYALELVTETGMSGAKPVSTPLEINQKLTSTEYDRHVSSKAEISYEVLENPATYQRIAGRLLYLTIIRPDIALVVQVLSQYMHCPKKSHMEDALRVVRYIKGTPGMGLLMPAGTRINLWPIVIQTGEHAWRQEGLSQGI